MAKAIPNPEPPWSGSGPAGAGKASGGEAWDKEDLLPKDAVPLGGRAAGKDAAAGDSGLSAQLQSENAELRAIIADLQSELEAVSGKNENNWAERQKEYESLLDEKTELIRQLHVKMQDMEQQFGDRRAAAIA